MFADNVFQRVFSSERGTLFCVNFVWICLQLLYEFITTSLQVHNDFIFNSIQVHIKIKPTLIRYANFFGKNPKKCRFWGKLC